MLWFKREKRQKPSYPAVYSDWLKEFGRLNDFYLSEQDANMLKGGVLSDSKYSLEYFEHELSKFLSGQLEIFLQGFGKAVARYIEENNSEYLLLTVRRYKLEFERLFFFEDFGFLKQKYRDDLKKELKDKLTLIEKELITYLDKISIYSASMSDVSLNLRRMIEV